MRTAPQPTNVQTTPKSVWVPALVFAGICLLFVFAAFFRPELNNSQKTIINFVFALIAGFATYFLGGTALLTIAHRPRGTGFNFGFSATAGIAVFALVYFHPLFASTVGHVFTPEEKQVFDLQDQVMFLRGTHESVAVYGETARAEVNEKAPKLASALLSVPAGKIDFNTRILQQEYAEYALMLAASTETDIAKKQDYAQKGIAAHDKARELMAWGWQHVGDAATIKATMDWTQTDDDDARIEYLLAMLQCIKGRASGDLKLQSAVIETLNAIPTSFKAKYPPANTPDLAPCLVPGDRK